MNIAVTGAHGFLGRYTIKAIEKQGFICTVFDRAKHDLLKPETLEDFVFGQDVVIHLAGINRGSDSELMKVNVLGTMGLLEAIALYSPTCRLVFSSSFQAYLKDSFYGISKKLAEECIVSYASKKGIKSTILRMSNIYGPGCRPFYNSVIATLAYQIKTGKKLTINGDGNQKRDYVYVTDVANAIVKATSHVPKTTDFFNICSGRQVKLNEIVRRLQKYSKKNVEAVYNKSVKSDDWGIKKSYSDATKILGWRPTTGIDQGLKAVLKE